MYLYKVVNALETFRVPYAIVGGFAVALHGAVRGTMDLDLVLRFTLKDFERAEQALQSIGFRARLPVNGAQVFRFREEYIKNRNLVAWSFYHPEKPSEIVDVIITNDLSQMKVTEVVIGTATLKVASIEDLIRMKKQSARPQDLEDVAALKRLQQKR